MKISPCQIQRDLSKRSPDVVLNIVSVFAINCCLQVLCQMHCSNSLLSALVVWNTKLQNNEFLLLH